VKADIRRCCGRARLIVHTGLQKRNPREWKRRFHSRGQPHSTASIYKYCAPNGA